MTTSRPGRQVLWEPSEERMAASRMRAYQDWLARERDVRRSTCHELWR